MKLMLLTIAFGLMTSAVVIDTELPSSDKVNALAYSLLNEATVCDLLKDHWETLNRFASFLVRKRSDLEMLYANDGYVETIIPSEFEKYRPAAIFVVKQLTGSISDSHKLKKRGKKRDLVIYTLLSAILIAGCVGISYGLNKFRLTHALDTRSCTNLNPKEEWKCNNSSEHWNMTGLVILSFFDAVVLFFGLFFGYLSTKTARQLFDELS
eukprot:NODE_540_length_6251_cov_1.082250.p5 type:complete len:210 gc:universal NODE_540_length_6251_cov_1.082250:4946-5575(+)